MATPATNSRWHRSISDAYNVPYWWHQDTNESVWVRPDGYVSAEDPLDEVRASDAQRAARRSASAEARASIAGKAPTSSQGSIATTSPGFSLLLGAAAVGTHEQKAAGAVPLSRNVKHDPGSPSKKSPLAGRGVFGGKRYRGLGAAIVRKAKEARTGPDMATIVSAASGKPLSSNVERNPMAAAKAAANRWKGKTDDRLKAPHLELSPSGVLGVPVRDILQSLYQSKRDKALFEGIVYLMWAAIFLILVYSCTYIQLSYNVFGTVTNRFIDQERDDVTYIKTWRDVQNMEDWWGWVDNTLYQGLYVSTNYNGQELPDGQLGYVDRYLRVVGAIRLRQLRVRSDSCSDKRRTSECSMESVPGNTTQMCLPRFDTKDGTCYADFALDAEDKTSFGPPEDPLRYRYEKGMSAMSGLYGWGPYYGTGGFTVYLPADNATMAWQIIRRMEADAWTSRATRAVAVDFNLYSTAAALVTCVRITFELTNVGFVLTDYRVLSFPLQLGPPQQQAILTILQIVYIVFIAYYAQKVVKGIYWSRPKSAYFKRIDNLFEILLIAVNGALIRSWILYSAAPQRASFSASATSYVDMFELASVYQDLVSLAGFIGLLACLKFFRYMALNKRMNSLWLTLGKALPELIAFTVSFFLLVAGYAFLGQMLFGSVLDNFHSIESSVSTLLRMALGDFNYESLSAARPAVVGLFFGSYVTLVFLVCLNLIIAILSSYYEEVHEELQVADKWKLSVLTMDAYIIKYITLYLRTHCQCVHRVTSYCQAFGRRHAGKCTCCAPRRALSSAATPSSVARRATRRDPGTPDAALGGADAVATVTNPMSRVRRNPNASDESREPLAAGQNDSSRRIVARKSMMKVAALMDVNEDEARQAAWKEAQRARQLVMDRQQLESWKHEREFMAALRTMYHMGKRSLGFDLYEYCEGLSEQVGWDQSFIGVHELCVLTNPNPCQPGSHSTCRARKLCEAYCAVKCVTMTGGLTGAFRHVPTTSFINMRDFKKFEVVKINTNGLNQRRQLIVDTDNCCLVNLDMRGRVKKKLPLVQLIQIERVMADSTRLNLVFSSNGAHMKALSGKDRELDDLLETSYMLSFQDERRREAFMDEVLAAIDNLPQILANVHMVDGIDAAGDAERPMSSGGDGATPGATPLGIGARTRRNSLTTKVLDAARDEYTRKHAMISTTSSLAQLVSMLEQQQAAVAAAQIRAAADPRSAAARNARDDVDSATLSLIVTELRLQREATQAELQSQRALLQSLAARMGAHQ